MRYYIIALALALGGCVEVETIGAPTIYDHLDEGTHLYLEINATSADSTLALEHQVRWALGEWLDALQSTTSAKLALAGEAVDNSPYPPVFSVRKHDNDEGHAFVLGAHISLYRWDFTDVLLHEMGHIFGLRDTYNGDVRCAGQELSVMCDERVGIQPIDTANVHAQLCKYRPDLCKN